MSERRVTFSQSELDEAAESASLAAISGLPARIGDFLTRAQTEELQEELFEATKTSLLFSLMNHLENSE